jgi:hypothetical protein
MTDRFTAIDVRDLAITLLEDSSSGFNNMIATINTERTHTTPLTTQVTYKWGQNQFPFIFVDIDSSEGLSEDYTLDMSYTNLPEVYTLNVMGTLKYAHDDVQNYAEDWIEAVIRVLHNYTCNGVTYIMYTNTERAEIYSKMNERLKTFLVSFEARVN